MDLLYFVCEISEFKPNSRDILDHEQTECTDFPGLGEDEPEPDIPGGEPGGEEDLGPADTD